MAAESSPQASRDYFLDSAGGAFIEGKTLSRFEDASRILDGVAVKRPANGLVLHFHGGLVSRDYALSDIVPRLSKRYLDASAYPLFFVWESGVKETLINNRQDLLRDPTFRELVKKVTEWTLRKASSTNTVVVRGDDGVPIRDIDRFREQYDEYFDGKREAPPVPDPRDAGGTPGTITKDARVDEQELQLEIQTELEAGFDGNFNEAIGRAYNASIPTAEVTTKGAGTGTSERADQVLLDEAALDEMFPPVGAGVKTRGFFTWAAVAKFVAKIVVAVVKRFRHDRDHGVYCTVVEEVLRGAFLNLVGGNVWNQMKNDTLDSFRDGHYCGTAVIEQLKILQAGERKLKKLTLVGHSTGAIYICNFLDAAKAAGLSFEDVQIIFLAPAVTCWRFADSIRQHGDGFLKNFRMFAMRDELESEDVLVPVLYTRSLLYFVSGLLEGRAIEEGWEGALDMPLVGMKRFFEIAHKNTFEDDADVQTVLTFLEDAPHRTVWSSSMNAGNGLNSDSRKHGDFDDDDATLASVVDLIKR